MDLRILISNLARITSRYFYLWSIYIGCGLWALTVSLIIVQLFTGALSRIWNRGEVKLSTFELFLFFGTFLSLLYILIIRGFAAYVMTNLVMASDSYTNVSIDIIGDLGRVLRKICYQYSFILLRAITSAFFFSVTILGFIAGAAFRDWDQDWNQAINGFDPVEYHLFQIALTYITYLLIFGGFAENTMVEYPNV
jgi:hypothetical protein